MDHSNSLVDIPRTASDFLDVVYVMSDVPEISLYLHDVTLKGISTKFPRNIYLIDVVVLWANANPA